MAASVMDYIFRRLALDFLPYERRAELGIFTAAERAAQLRAEAAAASGVAGVDEPPVDMAALASSAPIETPVVEAPAAPVAPAPARGEAGSASVRRWSCWNWCRARAPTRRCASPAARRCARPAAATSARAAARPAAAANRSTGAVRRSQAARARRTARRESERRNTVASQPESRSRADGSVFRRQEVILDRTATRAKATDVARSEAEAEAEAPKELGQRTTQSMVFDRPEERRRALQGVRREAQAEVCGSETDQVPHPAHTGTRRGRRPQRRPAPASVAAASSGPAVNSVTTRGCWRAGATRTEKFISYSAAISS